MWRVVLLVGLPAFLLTAANQAPQDRSKADADLMRKKLATIVARGEQKPEQKPEQKTGQKTAQKPSPLRTTFTDREANAYFKVDGPDFLPPGVMSPEVTIDAGGKVSARATVDLDKALKPSVFNPLSWFGGKTEVTAFGVVRGENGMGTLQIERATLSGISIPQSVLQQVVSYYTRSPEMPNGFNIDEPFELPSKIRSVETAKGQATVVQP
jgi:hypothetical protein